MPEDLNIVLPSGEPNEVTIKDNGFYLKDSDEAAFSLEDVQSKGYKYENNKLLDNEGKEVTLNKEFIETFKQSLSTPTGDVEQIEIDGEVYNLDKDGNAVGKDGQVFKTKQELDDLENTIYIDDKPYKLDANGNAVNEDGSIFKKADEVQELLDQQDNPLNIKAIQELSNIVIKDESGKPIEYENTPEGLAKYVLDVRNYGAATSSDSYLQQYLEKYPWIGSAMRYYDENGNLDGFGKREDYSKVQIDEENKDQHSSIIIAGKIAKGETPEEAKRLAKFYADDGRSAEVAKAELKYLQNKQKQEDDVNSQSIAEQYRNQLEEAKKTWGVYIDEDGSIKATDDKGTIYDKIVRQKTIKTNSGKEIKLPAVIKRTVNNKVITSEPKDFFNYVYQVKNYNIDGQIVQMTQYDYDDYMENKDNYVDNTLIKALQKFTGKNHEDIINNFVKQQEVNKIKKLYTSGQGRRTTRNNRSTGKIVLPSHLQNV